MDDNYIPRLFNEMLDFALKTKEAVLVVGPKQCGKTTTTKRHAKTIIDLMPLEGRQDLIDLASRSLRKIVEDVDIEKTGSLTFLMIVTKNKVAKRRKDGVYVVPLACLKN